MKVRRRLNCFLITSNLGSWPLKLLGSPPQKTSPTFFFISDFRLNELMVWWPWALVGWACHCLIDFRREITTLLCTTR